VKRLRVLILAEAANPEWVSVPLVGWSMARAIADVADTVVVTQVRNREAFLRAGLVEGRDFVAIDTERVSGPLWKLANFIRGGAGVGWTTLTAIASISYPYFELLAWRCFKAELAAGGFDLVHRVTPLTPTAPSLFAKRCARLGVPFIVGPLNGGVPWPKEFGAARRQERGWLSYVRAAYKLLPGYRSTIKYAAAILGGSRYTLSQLPRAWRDKYSYLAENGIDPARFAGRCVPYESGPLRLCFVGRLVPYKGLDMVLDAAEDALRSGAVTLDVVGNGPMTASISEAIERKQLQSAVTLHGWVDHAGVQDVLRRCHVLSFPSIREFGGGVVLEAMTLGVVPLVVDYAGPAELVDADVGVKVPLGARERIVAALRAAIDRLRADPAEVRRLSSNCVERVAAQYTWSAKAAKILDVYRRVIAAKPGAANR
jgi:glycosyltransferase involved in cell wall biosynthesis